MKKLLFFGDSVTDAERNRNASPNSFNSDGCGFVAQIAATLYATHPNEYLIYNRGINGNKIVDLYARLKRDVWNITPDVLTILVGVNDLWHELECNDGVEPERFEKIYRMVLGETHERLPHTKIILIEPFIVKGEVTGRFAEGSFNALSSYQSVVRRLAKEYGFDCIDMQSEFDLLCAKYGTEAFFLDGVHPKLAGAKIIAEKWLQNYRD